VTAKKQLTLEDLPDIISVQQVADFLGVSKNTLYSWCNTGELTSFKIGNTRRIRKSVLLNWIEQKERQQS
jgi:excisionase family DNA binding protein